MSQLTAFDRAFRHAHRQGAVVSGTIETLIGDMSDRLSHAAAAIERVYHDGPKSLYCQVMQYETVRILEGIQGADARLSVDGGAVHAHDAIGLYNAGQGHLEKYRADLQPICPHAYDV